MLHVWSCVLSAPAPSAEQSCEDKQAEVQLPAVSDEKREGKGSTEEAGPAEQVKERERAARREKPHPPLLQQNLIPVELPTPCGDSLLAPHGDSQSQPSALPGDSQPCPPVMPGDSQPCLLALCGDSQPCPSAPRGDSQPCPPALPEDSQHRPYALPGDSQHRQLVTGPSPGVSPSMARHRIAFQPQPSSGLPS